MVKTFPNFEEVDHLFMMTHIYDDTSPIFNKTRTVRGSDYSPAVELSEQKDKLVTENWRD